MNNPDAKRNLNESGYVLHGQEVEPVYGKDLDLASIEDGAKNAPPDEINKIRNFESLDPQDKKDVLGSFVNSPLQKMLVEIAIKDKNLLAEANRLFNVYIDMSGVDSAEEFIAGIDRGDWSNAIIERTFDDGINLNEIRQDLLILFMSDTVEMDAYAQAREKLEQKLDLKAESIEPVGSMPPIKGYLSGIAHANEDRYSSLPKNYSIGVWEDLIDVVESANYHTGYKLGRQELTDEVTDVIATAAEYNDASWKFASWKTAKFSECLAWAQLNPISRERIRKLHTERRICFGPGLAKFIGKVEPNRYEAAYRATQRSIDNITKKLSENPEDELLQSLLLLEKSNLEDVTRKYQSNLSMLDKALDLTEAYVNASEEIDIRDDFWTTEARLGEISWAYNALRNGVGLESIMKFTVMHRAVGDYGEEFGIHTVTRNLMDLAENQINSLDKGFVFKAKFQRIANVYNFAKENFPGDDSVYLDLQKVLSLGGSFYLDDILESLKDRKSIAFLANNEWVLRSAQSVRVDKDDEFGIKSGLEIDIFPYDKDIRAQYDWIAKYALTVMDGVDVDAQAKLVLHRLRMGVDKNLHDATYWLAELSMDRERINNQYELGKELIESLLITNDQNELAKFPTNQKRLAEMFIEKRQMTFYLSLLELKRHDSSWGSSTEEMLEFSKKFPGDRSIKPVRKFNEVLEDLKEAADYRKEYSRVILKWLSTHSDAPRDILVQAWKGRAMALADGCADNPRAIINWNEHNALKMAIERGDLKLTQEEFEANREFFMTVVKAVPVDEMDRAFKWYKKRSSRQILPAAVVEPKEGYKFEILSKDDPRGFTIGFETGCCMTVDGVSESCIKSGYRHEDCGFLALYGPGGKIRAQSYWYINPRYPNVLVLDNIEANEGRDFGSIVELYKASIQDYLAEHPELGITEVHVGTGYTDVDLKDLKAATAVENVHGEYTDAHNQKMLYELKI
jgi:hypothetical protein